MTTQLTLCTRVCGIKHTLMTRESLALGCEVVSERHCKLMILQLRESVQLSLS